MQRNNDICTRVERVRLLASRPDVSRPARARSTVVTARDAGTAAMISSSAASTLDTAASTSSSSATYRVASIAVASNSTSRSRNRRYAFCASTPAVSSSLTSAHGRKNAACLTSSKGARRSSLSSWLNLRLIASRRRVSKAAPRSFDLRKRGDGAGDVSLRHTRVFDRTRRVSRTMRRAAGGMRWLFAILARGDRTSSRYSGTVSAGFT